MEVQNSSSLTRPGRVNGKNSYYRSGTTRVGHHVLNEIDTFLSEHRDKAAFREKKVSNTTQERREMGIKNFFSDLFFLGYKLESVHNLKQKHLTAVFRFLEEQKQSPSTIQNKVSMMRRFCNWIGKPGMVMTSSVYVRDKAAARRTMVVKEDKSWEGKGIDVTSVLQNMAKEDKYAHIWLELCWAFGLRVKEAVMLRPAAAQEGSFIWVREGTKGDRPRVVPIENSVQVDVLERAALLADKKTGMLGVRGTTVEQKVQRLYYVMRKAGLTLAKSQVSAHGLRHQYMHNAFEKLTGVKPPVTGGSLADIDPDQLHVTSQKLMERAGHTRVSIGASYYGSRRRPGKPMKKADAAPPDCPDGAQQQSNEGC